MDRTSRVTGFGDDGSSVGLQAVGFFMVPRIIGYLSRKETVWWTHDNLQCRPPEEFVTRVRRFMGKK